MPYHGAQGCRNIRCLQLDLGCRFKNGVDAEGTRTAAVTVNLSPRARLVATFADNAQVRDIWKAPLDDALLR